MDGGPHDDTVVIANFADRTVEDLADRLSCAWPVGRPPQLRLHPLRARLRCHEAFDIDADGAPMDGFAQSGLVAVAPYGVVILSREA